MSRRLRTALLMTPMLVGLGGVVAACGSSSSSSASAGTKIVTFRVLTVDPHTKTLDFPPLGKSPGDVYVFDATIVATNGRTLIGRLRGTQTSIKLENGSETVQGMLTYEFGAGNEIVIGGLSANPVNGSSFLIQRKAFVRPVLGGSGKYFGAVGTVTSTYLGANRYQHVFRVVLPNQSPA
jgi:hypothetical protein